MNNCYLIIVIVFITPKLLLNTLFAIYVMDSAIWEGKHLPYSKVLQILISTCYRIMVHSHIRSQWIMYPPLIRRSHKEMMACRRLDHDISVDIYTYPNNTKFMIYFLEKSGKHDGKPLAKSCCYEKCYYIHGSTMEGAALFFNEVAHANTSMFFLFFFLNICWGICIYLQKIHKEYIKCKVREIFNR